MKKLKTILLIVVTILFLGSLFYSFELNRIVEIIGECPAGQIQSDALLGEYGAPPAMPTVRGNDSRGTALHEYSQRMCKSLSFVPRSERWLPPSKNHKDYSYVVPRHTDHLAAVRG